MLRAHSIIALQGSNPMSRSPRAELGLSTVFQSAGAEAPSLSRGRSWVLGCDVLTWHFADTKWGCLLAHFLLWM